MKFDLTPLLGMQKKLDAVIAVNHGVDYDSTYTRRFLALLVELGELANETRCFKYWSNKSSSPADIVLDEYADGLHFLLSLGVMLDIGECAYEGKDLEPYNDPSSGFVYVYRTAIEMYLDFDKDHWIKAMESYVRLLVTLGYNMDEAIAAYLSKMEVNFERQREGY